MLNKMWKVEVFEGGQWVIKSAYETRSEANEKKETLEKEGKSVRVVPR